MAAKKIIFSNHAVQQMFQRSIPVKKNVKFVLQNGIPVNEYPGDKPLAGKLLFACCNSRNLHDVCSENHLENETIVITAYKATTDSWENDFITRKK